MTNRYVDFLDEVARAVGKVHPDWLLSFYCYADYTQPPTTGGKLSPNLCAFIAPIRYCRLHPVGHPGCASREQQVTMTDGWAAVASRLGYYNYMYNLADGTLPMFKFSACQKEFPYLADKGLTYIQSGFDPSRHVQQAKALRQKLGDEVLVHLEFIRTKEGAMNCSGLQLIRFSTEQRLNEIMARHSGQPIERIER